MIMLLVYITVKTTMHSASRESICSTLFATFPICLWHDGQKNLNLLSDFVVFVVTSLKKKEEVNTNLSTSVMKIQSVTFI